MRVIVTYTIQRPDSKTPETAKNEFEASYFSVTNDVLILFGEDQNPMAYFHNWLSAVRVE